MADRKKLYATQQVRVKKQLEGDAFEMVVIDPGQAWEFVGPSEVENALSSGRFAEAAPAKEPKK